MMMLLKIKDKLRENKKAEQMLQLISTQVCENLNLVDDLDIKVTKIIDLLFNPYNKTSSLRKTIQKLPIFSNLIDLDKDLFEYLTKEELILVFQEDDKKFVTVTPEGAIIASLDSSIYHNITFYETLLFNEYKKKSQRNIIRLSRSMEEKKLLGINQLSITLFLLINGSIGDNKKFILDSDEVENAVNDIIKAFKYYGKEKKGRVYPFNWYLTTAKSIMGNVFYNEYPEYYILDHKVDVIKTCLRRSIKEINDFEKRWLSFLDEYKKQRPTLRSYGLSYFSIGDVLELENLLLRR